MPQRDYIYNLHGSGTTASNIFQTAAGYSDYEIDFGTPVTGTASPYITVFPSSTEKGYTLPAEAVGNGGVEFGVHLVIGTAVSGGSITTGTVNVTSSAASASTAVIASRVLSNAQLGQAGGHYFVSVPQMAVLEFLRCEFVPTTGNAGAGTGFAWYGPKTGGES